MDKAIEILPNFIFYNEINKLIICFIYYKFSVRTSLKIMNSQNKVEVISKVFQIPLVYFLSSLLIPTLQFKYFSYLYTNNTNN